MFETDIFGFTEKLGTEGTIQPCPTPQNKKHPSMVLPNPPIKPSNHICRDRFEPSFADASFV